MSTKRAYSPRSAAEEYDVSEATIRKAIHASDGPLKISAYRVGRAIRIPRDEMERWIRAGVLVGSTEDQKQITR